MTWKLWEVTIIVVVSLNYIYNYCGIVDELFFSCFYPVFVILIAINPYLYKYPDEIQNFPISCYLKWVYVFYLIKFSGCTRYIVIWVKCINKIKTGHLSKFVKASQNLLPASSFTEDLNFVRFNFNKSFFSILITTDFSHEITVDIVFQTMNYILVTTSKQV